jgi:hypothetical protein
MKKIKEEVRGICGIAGLSIFFFWPTWLRKKWEMVPETLQRMLLIERLSASFDVALDG